MKLCFWLGGLTVVMVAAQVFGCIGAPFTLTGGTGGMGGGTASSGASAGSGAHPATTTSTAGGSSSTGVTACMPGQMDCGKGCVDVGIDPANCGMCGHDCGPNTACQTGKCGCALPGMLYCDTALGCVATGTPEHCGGCKACPNAGDTCFGGHCLCPGGGVDCGTSCADLKLDPLNCGMCGKVCDVDQACVAGSCVCRAGTSLCGNHCVDTHHDPGHCGNCSNACQGGDKCDGTTCVSDCPMGTTECNGGCYAAFTDDPANCGMCNQACTVDQVCIAGGCQGYFFPGPACTSCPCLPTVCNAGDACCKVPVGSGTRVACVAGGSCG